MLANYTREELRQLLNGFASPMFVVGVGSWDDFVYLGANAALTELTGLTEEALVGQTPGDILLPGQAAAVVAQYRRCVQSRQPVEFTDRFTLPVGVRWWRTRLNPALDETGKVVRILGTTLDATDEQRNLEELRTKALLLNSQQELMPDGVIVATPEGEFISWNNSFLHMWSLSEDNLRGGRSIVLPLMLEQLTEPERYQARVDVLYRQPTQAVEGAELLLKDGRTFVWSSSSLPDEAPGRKRVWFFRDITRRKTMELRLREAQALQQSILDSSSQIIFTVDSNLIIRSMNRAGERLLGYQSADLIGRETAYLFHDAGEIEARRAALSRKLGRAIRTDELFQFGGRKAAPTRQEWTYITKEGVRFPAEIYLSELIDGEGRQLGFLSVVSDISERKEQERKLHQLATTDPLTGLWNRRYFLERAEQLLRYAHRHKQEVTIALVDVDHFKRINDNHGHDAGDAMLRTVAEVLQDVMRETDLYCRWGGEEFLLALPHTTGEDALGVLERLRSAMSAVVLEHGDALIRATLSAGVSDWRASESTLDQAVRRADRALYRAKGDGRNCVRAEWSQDDAAGVA